MTVCLLVLALAACRSPSVTQLPPPIERSAAAPGPPAPDPWLGQDKVRHLGLSFAATTFGYATARFALDPDAAALAAAGAAALAGIGKEALDRRRGRPFSLRDLLWDAAGIAAALTLVDRIR